MKNLIILFAVAVTLGSCSQSGSEGSAQDSTSVKCDSTQCDSTKCDTTHAACHTDSVKVDSAAH
jgi:hypothetical protein